MLYAAVILALSGAVPVEPPADAAGAATATQVRTFGDYPNYEQVGLRWVRGPSVRDLARQHVVSTNWFPNRGMAEVACTPDARGRLACEAISADPPGRGFDKAALRVMAPVRVAAVDGGSPEGRTFAFRLRFGAWPESLIPDTFHPVDQNLRWVKRPELARYNLAGLGAQREARATFDCIAAADGSLACTAEDNASAPRGFVEAAADSLSAARVERVDNAPLAGSPLKWTFRVVNQSHCATGGTGYGNPGQGSGATTADPGSPSIGADPYAAVGSLGGSAPPDRGSGSCLGAIVQMY